MSKDILGRKIPPRTDTWKQNIAKALRRGKVMNCVGCKTKFYCQRYRYTNREFVKKYGKPKYCSMGCQRQYRKYGQSKGTKQPNISLTKRGEKNPMFGQKPNHKQLDALKLGRKKRRTPEELRWNKTKCDLRRKGRRHYNGGRHTFEQWRQLREDYRFTCPSCEKVEPEIKLTEDHIVPISKGGSDDIANIQPLCVQCNVRKKTKIIKYETL